MSVNDEIKVGREELLSSLYIQLLGIWMKG